MIPTRESATESGKESTGSGTTNTSKATTTHPQVVSFEAVAVEILIPLNVILLLDQEKTPLTAGGDIERITHLHLRAAVALREAAVP